MKLPSSLQQVLTQRKSDLTAVDLESPLDVVGSFLTKVLRFDGDILHKSLLPKRYTAHSDEPSNRLYSTPNFNQSQLVQLIIQIYDGPPEPYEVFHCLPTTNEQVLKLFMKRVVKHPRQYLVLEVNRLPYLLQEVLVLWPSKADIMLVLISSLLHCPPPPPPPTKKKSQKRQQHNNKNKRIHNCMVTLNLCLLHYRFCCSCIWTSKMNHLRVH